MSAGPMPTLPLFRAEALEHRQGGSFGAAVLRPPVSTSMWCVVAATLASTVIALFWFGTYTARTRVVGVTVPSAGLVKVLAPPSGVVVDRRVGEGSVVRTGDVLFVVSGERMTGSPEAPVGAQTVMLEQLRRRRESLVADLALQGAIARRQTDGLIRRHADLLAEAAQARREIETQRRRAASAAAQAERFDALAKQQFVSAQAAEQKHDELLDQTQRLQSLGRALLALERDAETVALELAQWPSRARQQRAETERAIALVDQDIASTDATRRIAVTAPQDGVVTAILAEPGQPVSGQPLLTLLPRGGALDVHLYVPSKAVGFVETGQSVRVRFAAYPHQKFGQAEGRVVQVARSTIVASELPPQLAALAQQTPNDGFYRVVVQLASQTVTAYGKPQPLTAGMQLEADVMREERRLIDWVFDPVLGLKGRL